MSLRISIVTVQSGPANKPAPIVDPAIVRKLNDFISSARIMRFTYDSSVIPDGGEKIVFTSRMVDTREVMGKISKDMSGSAVFTLTIDEKNITGIGESKTPANQIFEGAIKGAYIGLRVVGKQKVISTDAQVVGMPPNQWGARIIQPLKDSGTYDVFLSATPIQSTTPKSATPKRKNYWEAGASDENWRL